MAAASEAVQKHQVAFPSAWTPAMVEATAAWTRGTRALTDFQSAALQLLGRRPAA